MCGGGGAPTSTSPLYDPTITVADGALQPQVVTSTDLPTTQTPTITNATGTAPETTGSIITTLETGGNPPLQPFLTSVPTISSATLQPSSETAPFSNATGTSMPTSSATVTVPLTTFETKTTSTIVTSIAVPGTYTLTTQVLEYTTYTSGGSTMSAFATETRVYTTVVTMLSETTLSATMVSTGTLSTTLTTNLIAGAQPTATLGCLAGSTGQDVFLPIDIGPPPNVFPVVDDHPVPRTGINQTTPLETNKFYANLFLGGQGSPTFVTPYSLTWSKGSGNAMSWGMAISHIDRTQEVLGPQNTIIPTEPNAYYINPIGIQPMILSAAELGKNTVLTTDSLEPFSVNAHLAPNPGSSCTITFPLVQGMCFATGIYNDLQPIVQSSVFFRTVKSAGSPRPGVYKYQATLEDGNIWNIYATPSNGLNPNFQLTSSTMLQGLQSWSGIIQVAKNPGNASNVLYDNAVGAYPTSATISGYASGPSANYSFTWNKGGPFADNTTMMMFALPHHLQSFDSSTAAGVTSLQLQTLTKGLATAVIRDCWILQENNMAIDMGFSPWRPQNAGGTTSLTTTALALIQNVSAIEASQNMTAQTYLNSMYYAGKGFSKFATICYVMNDMSAQQNLSTACLTELKQAFTAFLDNDQPWPLFYETAWKGVVSSASYILSDPGQDFGNTYYNDHHFHWGYFLHAAAVIGYLDPTWAIASKGWVNALARDASNPSNLDQWFPVSRSFDWYCGHSWAHGLFESGDGKDEESTSEDAMFAYGLKMWGRTIGDPSMEARGNLMLSVLSRALQNYFLMESDNVNQPAGFIGNKAPGITFENKVDHATYFGSNLEYIEGIHMIPICAFSALTRSWNFVVQEWISYFADGACNPASNVLGGWKGILYANLALINPTASWNFFSNPAFDSNWLDGGASRTWYLAFAAALGGGPD